VQVPSPSDSMEEEEVEEVMLFWNEGKTEKSVRDLVLDNQPGDQELLSYYRYRINNKLVSIELDRCSVIQVCKSL